MELRTAKIAMKESDYERAIRNLDLELQNIPSNAEAWYLKGYCYEKLGRMIEMSEAYNMAVKLSPQYEDKVSPSINKLVNRYYLRSINAYDSSKWVGALTQIDTAIMIDPDNYKLHRQAAITCYYGDMYEKSIEYAEKSIKFEEPGDSNLEVRKVLLAIYREKTDYDGIIKWAQNIMKRINIEEDEDGDYLRTLDDLIIAYTQKGELQKAEEIIRDAITKFPEIGELKLNLATMKFRQDDFETASQLFREVLQNDPENVAANLTMGHMLIAEYNYLEAIPYLEKVLAADENNIYAVQDLATAYYNTEQEEKGRLMIDKLKVLKKD